MGRNRLDIEINRWKKIERHKKRRKNRKYDPNKLNINNSNSFIKQSKVQKNFRENNFYEKIAKTNDCIIITIPQIFCLIENPEESIKVLKQINYTFYYSKIKNIIFDYSRCEKLALDTSVLTDIIVKEGLKFRRKNLIRTNLEGNTPDRNNNYIAFETFLTSGLVKHLGVSNAETPAVERLEPFDTAKDPTVLTNKALEYYNNTLKMNGYELNANGISYFSDLIGEVIGNAEDHSGENGDWYVSGHFTQNIEGEYGKGYLTFVSIGNTIYESLKSDEVDIITQEKLKQQTKYHKSLFNYNWNEESSWTVFGLQYMVSSKKEEHSHRGTGTIKFIESFSLLGNTLGEETPKMMILSGRTHIIFDGTYTLKNKKIHNTQIPVIAFNKENDLKRRPDSNYVKLLKHKFPGVIISVEFYVDRRYLNKIKEERLND